MKLFKKNNHSDHSLVRMNALVMPLSAPYTLLVFLFLASAFLIVLTPQNSKAQNLKNQIKTQHTVEYTPEENKEYCTTVVRGHYNYVTTHAVNSPDITSEERAVIFYRCRKHINASPEFGRAPLMAATRLGKVDIVKQLLVQYNAHPDVGNPSGRTPLHVAIRNNNYEITQALLVYGARSCDPDPESQGPVKTPYQLAKEAKDYRIFKLLKAVTQSDKACRYPELEDKSQKSKGFKPSKELAGTYDVIVGLGYGYQHEFQLKINPNGSMTYSEEQPPPGVQYLFSHCKLGTVTLDYKKLLSWKDSICGASSYISLDLDIGFYNVRGDLIFFEPYIRSNHIFHVDSKGQAVLPEKGQPLRALGAVFTKIVP